MSNSTSKPELIAHWERTTPAAHRWQALQAQLSELAVSDASHWTRRSFVTCKWRVLPAGVSAPANVAA